MSKQLEEARAIIKPFDVACFCNVPNNYPREWWNPMAWFQFHTDKAIWDGIVSDQRNYFGNKVDVGTNHVELWQGDKFLNAQPPTVRYTTIEEAFWDGCRFIIMRPTFYDFTTDDATMMKAEWEKVREYKYEDTGETKSFKMIDSQYDIGQCLDIFVNGILGYPDREKFSPFGKGTQIVCSVAVRTGFELYRQIKGALLGKDPYPTLFSTIIKEKFNDSPWKDAILKDFENKGKVYAELTTPGHFMPDVQEFFASPGLFREVYRSF